MSWRSKKQDIVMRSSAKANFVLWLLGCVNYWLKIILDDLKITRRGSKNLFYENKSEMNIAHNPLQYNRTKHVEIDRYFIKEKLETRFICIPFVP